MKTISLGSIIFSLALMQAGCVVIKPSENLKRSYTAVYQSPSIIDFPVAGEVKTVEVGESLVRKDKQTIIPSIDIEQAAEYNLENLGKKFTMVVLPGRYMESGKDAFGKFYKSAEGKILVDGQPFPSSLTTGIYVLDSDTKKTEIWIRHPNAALISYDAIGIPFTKSVYQRWDELSFKKELVYTGISQNVVSVMYREYQNDMARPAFSQDLKYDLSESKTVGYRGSRFEIIKATNQGLTYKTLKQLD